ncbi:MAG TPA: 50S ribosomal protein L25 [Thermotogota bacterium]|nr:50S ribosomal protein L25 [Thermotogota bacterium]HPJ88693.1 50S ribosomal protein L25 [Thermotogota bacterium]HPR95958.1 50S ribosomal protein L25 [Thermotogota bacterium]
MKKITIEVTERNRVKTSGSRKIRRDGFIPAIVYGPDFEPTKVEVNYSNFDSIIHRITNTTPLTLRFTTEDGKGEEKLTYLKHVQRHRVTDRPIHIDFYAPSAGHTMHIEVPVKAVNEPKGLEKGGVIEHHYETLPIEALPKDIPEFIEIDVAELDLGEHIQLKDVKLPEGVKVLLDEEDIIVSVLAPRGTDGSDEEGEESAEPKVIGEVK